MPSRRFALGLGGTAIAAGVAGAAAAPASAKAQARPAAAPALAARPAGPIPPMLERVPVDELVTPFQFLEQAVLAQGAAKMAPVLGSDRTVTDRITLMPRVCIPARDMDLTVNIFGDDHFTPILVGPMANQKRWHPEGEVATARGAGKAKAGIILSADSDVPLATAAAATNRPVWVQVYAGSPKLRDTLAEAGAAKAKAVVVTVGAGTGAGARGGSMDWSGVDAVVKGTSLPVVVKGITTPAEAREAVKRGAKGVVVSNWRGGDAAALPGTLLMIEPVVQAVGGQVPVFADGSFRWGSDILKALGFGATAVLVGRPVIWGLAGYGDEGVQYAIEFMQTDLARFMGMTGCTSVAAIKSLKTPLVRVHAPIPAARTNNV